MLLILILVIAAIKQIWGAIGCSLGQDVSIQLLEYSKTSPSSSSSPSSSPPSRSGDPPSISGTESGIIDPLVSKRPEKNSENFKMSKSNKCLNSKILGLVGFFLQKFTKHHRCGIFSESPG